MLTFYGVAGFRVVKLNVAGKAKISFSEQTNVCGMSTLIFYAQEDQNFDSKHLSL